MRGKHSKASRVVSWASTGLEMTPQPGDVESVAAAAAAAVPVVAGHMSKATARSLLAKARKDARFDEEGEYRVYQELLEGKTTRFVSRVMYDGTNYRGFQLQNNGQPTVQVRKAEQWMMRVLRRTSVVYQRSHKFTRYSSSQHY